MDNESTLKESLSAAGDQIDRYLEFDLGDESYCLPLLDVCEVIPVPDTTQLPKSPDYFVGIMNLRGQIISIVDLRKKLGTKTKEDNAEESVVIVKFGDISIGLVVDSINRVLTVPVSEISHVPEIQLRVNSRLIKGIYRGNDKLVVLLDIKSALDIEGIQKIASKAA